VANLVAEAVVLTVVEGLSSAHNISCDGLAIQNDIVTNDLELRLILLECFESVSDLGEVLLGGVDSFTDWKGLSHERLDSQEAKDESTKNWSDYIHETFSLQTLLNELS